MSTIHDIAVYVAIFTAGMLVGYLLKVVMVNKKYEITLLQLLPGKHCVKFVLKSEGVSRFGTTYMLFCTQNKYNAYKLWERY